MQDLPVRGRDDGLRHHADFVRLWTATTISVFGSLVTRTALPFAAILTLNATPWQVGVLGAAELAAQVLVGLVAGAWVDRLRRRPIMIVADLGRAAVLGSVPLAAALGRLSMEQLYAVALASGVLNEFFTVADHSYLPTLIPRERVLEANSRLHASSSISEIGAFGISGWLVQWLTAPIAILVDAVSFVVSALFIGLIRTPESPPARARRTSIVTEIAEGLETVWRAPVLRAMMVGALIAYGALRVFGAVFMLFTTRELGVPPSVQGMIFAVGGAAALLGAITVGRVTARFGDGRAMVAGVALMGAAVALVPLARGPMLLVVALLIVQQLGDGAFTIFDITEKSARQRLVAPRVLGRANATVRVAVLFTMLLASVAGGWLGGVIGLRPTLALAAGGLVVAAMWLAVSPARTLNTAAMGAHPDP